MEHPLRAPRMASLRAAGRELTVALSFETIKSQTYDNYNFLRKRLQPCDGCNLRNGNRTQASRIHGVRKLANLSK